MRKLIALREERPVLAHEIVYYEEYLSPRDTAYGLWLSHGGKGPTQEDGSFILNILGLLRVFELILQNIWNAKCLAYSWTFTF